MKQSNKNINSGVLTHNLCNKKAISIANNRNYGRPNRAPGKKFRLESLKWHILTRSSAPRIHPNALDEKLVAYVVSSYQGTITTVENPKKGQAPNKSGAATSNISQNNQNINSKTILLLRNYYGVIVKTMQNSLKDQLLQNSLDVNIHMSRIGALVTILMYKHVYTSILILETL